MPAFASTCERNLKAHGSVLRKDKLRTKPKQAERLVKAGENGKLVNKLTGVGKHKGLHLEQWPSWSDYSSDSSDGELNKFTTSL